MGETKIGVLGAAGRMGQMLIRQTAETEGCLLIGAVERSGSEVIGQDAGTLAGLPAIDLPVSDDPVALIAAADVVIDFTAPAATIEHSRYAAQGHTALVIGTTGIDSEGGEEIRKAARHTPVVWAANMSAGVTLLTAITEQVARALGRGWDIDILEMHHRMKVDAPSGTALALGHAAAAGRGVRLDDVMQPARHGHTGARKEGEIGFAVLRGGDVIGDHTVVLAGDGERIELTHKASGRHIYASGAVRAALWAAGRTPGLYDMRDVLGLSL